MLKNLPLRTFSLFAVCGLLLVGTKAFAGSQDFTVKNDTGVEIHELYVSPHSADDWEEDILGKDTLVDGDSLEINFSPKENVENWDLKIVDGGGNSIVWENLKLTEITDVVLHYEDGKATAEIKNGE